MFFDERCLPLSPAYRTRMSLLGGAKFPASNLTRSNIIEQLPSRSSHPWFEGMPIEKVIRTGTPAVDNLYAVEPSLTFAGDDAE